MKAFLLVAGKGTRLRPLTATVPKCLLPIKGTPILGIWLQLCSMYGITDVLINLHHLSDLVKNYLNRSSFGMNITTFYEENLLGSAGTVWVNKDFVKGEKCFLIIYGDNLTNINLKKMMDYHLIHGGILTLGLFKTQIASQCGIVKMDENHLVVSFTEKPESPVSDLANAGIYIAREEIFDNIPPKAFIDFGYDVLPRLVGQMYGYIIKEYLIDIGNFENYQQANREWRGL